jgi:ribosomal-protein-alanine N-acetyltransferase
MSVLTSVGAARPTRADRVYLRRPVPADAAMFIAAVHASQALHHPWVQAPGTVAAFEQYLERMSEPAHEPFLVRHRGTDALVGVINLTNIVLGSFCSGYLGYYAFRGYERQGLMREGLALVVQRSFEQLGLHRLEANIQPANQASLALARSCGFEREGFSPRYLKINGEWRDHERWAIVAP